MAKSYDSFFVRSYEGDTNSYPKPKESQVWTSPDIIPWGTSFCKDPKKELLNGNFNKKFDNEIHMGMVNYLYVRGKNYSKSTVDCNLYLYWSNSTMLLAPSTWKNNAIKCTKTNQDNIPLQIKAGQEAVCESDTTGIFAWTPEALGSDQHYCLVSRVDSAQYPAPIPNLKNVDDFSLFLRSESGMGFAQRNVRMKTAGLPDDKIVEQVENSFEQEICDAYMIVNCCGLPVGSAIQMTCPGSTSDCYLEIPKSVLTEVGSAQHPISFAAHIKKMPVGFKAPICVYFWSNNQHVPSSYEIQIDFVWVPSVKDKSMPYAQPLHTTNFQHITQGPDLVLTGNAAMEAIEPRKGIRIGSCKTQYR